MRAVSTVLDASLCLLLVTASALTLVGTPLASEAGPDSNPNPDTADETAEVLTTTTARVTYAVGDHNRTAHDTLAGLLAAAALADAKTADATLADSEEASTAVSQSGSTTFQRAVTAKVGRVLRRADVPLRGPDVGVQVVADSNPGRDALGSRIVAGEPPPSTADVHAARVEVRRVRLTVRTWSR
jgi:hypothetical protein